MNREPNKFESDDRPDKETGRIPHNDKEYAHESNGLNPDDSQRIADLKRGLEKTRLPADLRDQILAELSSPDERARLYREMQEKGGIPGDQFLKSLGL